MMDWCFNNKKTTEPVYIGEVYLAKYRWTTCPAHVKGASYFEWWRFTGDNRNVYCDHDDFVHIFGKCHKRENVIFYNDRKFDPYNDKKLKIEQRILKQRNKK